MTDTTWEPYNASDWPLPSAALAVDKALRAHDRETILGRLKGTPMEGAAVADWIDEAQNRDAYLEHTEAWHEQCFDSAATLLGYHYPDAPERYRGRLISAALMCHVLQHRRAPEGIHTVVELAERAACWADGYGFVALLARTD